ncbi:hypothetical protein [Synechocystis sp. FACHB-383]|uniref:hypothetical protein n=1 Tax=Synechocystis sp. FACHB-383 TaxID=2692864 RepID=UPI0018EF9EFB|nr:hypothetical protein [Synechocystis sp. FACHB-383]
MNTQDLLDKYFETAFSASDGIKRLRELILTLAMQGKLVPQDPTDQPARELLKEIEAEKQGLIRKEKIKQSPPLSEVNPDDKSCKLPTGWEKCTVNDLGFVRGGKRLPKGEQYS